MQANGNHTWNFVQFSQNGSQKATFATTNFTNDTNELTPFDHEIYSVQMKLGFVKNRIWIMAENGFW